MLQVKKLASFADLSSFKNSSVPFFQLPQYLEIFAKNFCPPEDLILLGIYEKENLIGYGAFEKSDDKIIFLGMKHVVNNQELTDYGDIWIKDGRGEKYASAWSAILNWFKENGSHDVQLDYVQEGNGTYKFFSSLSPVIPAQAGIQTPLVIDKTLDSRLHGNDIRVEEQAVAPYINLPTSWEEYISGLEYHNRRELRRKMNRLEREFGVSNYTFQSFKTLKLNETELKKYFAEFVRLVKLAEDEKQQFMTREMEKFFWDLVNIKTDTWSPVLNFLEIKGKNVAATLTFENGTESLAYNSGYDPAYKFYSAGFLVHAFKIRDLIVDGYKKHDFLRGNERYKYDLGGIDMRLYNVFIK